MNAPVSEQVKAEAAKSLLERLAEKTKLVRFFRYNASAKHGVPIDDDEDIRITPEERKPQPKPEQKSENVPGQNVVQVVHMEDEKKNQQKPQDTKGSSPSTSPMSDKVKGILQTLAVLGGLGAAGLTGYALSQGEGESKDNKPQTEAPYYSPYQYLEDTGEHLP